VERFFLAEVQWVGAPTMRTFGREMPSEAEAIVEAFRAGVNFYAISKFRTRAETSSSRYPVIKKGGSKERQSCFMTTGFLVEEQPDSIWDGAGQALRSLTLVDK
jgi:hypothetical protein